MQNLREKIKLYVLGASVLTLAYLVVKVPGCGQENVVQEVAPSASSSPLPPPPGGCGKTTFAEVKPIIQAKCVSCHAGYDTFAVAKNKGPDMVTRVNLLAGDPRMMPKGGQPLPDNEKQLFKLWGSDGFLESCAQPPQKKSFYNLDQIEAAIEDEGNRLNGQDREESRFLVLTHRVDQGSDANEMAIFSSGASKAVNTLNTKNGKVEKLYPVGPEGSILRIELEEFGLTKADWDLIVQNDPFKIISNTNRGKNIRNLFRTNQPWLHAENFALIAHGNANVYYTLTRTPNSFQGIVQKLGVDFNGDQRNFKANFMGTNKSPISDLKPRLVTQFKSDEGMFWMTFDPQALNGVARRSVFNAPLLIDTLNPLEFAAGEIIYTLRNGFQGYALVNAQGQLLKEADIGIVRDTSSPISAVIKNSISCHRCHAAGVIPLEAPGDEVKAHVQANASNFNANDVQRVLALYKDQSVNDKLFTDYNSPFKQALDKIGSSSGVDPLTYSTDHFQLNWNLNQLAAFVFLTPQEFTNALNQSANGKNQLGAVLTGSTVTLDQVIIGLPFVIRDARLFQDPLGR